MSLINLTGKKFRIQKKKGKGRGKREMTEKQRFNCVWQKTELSKETRKCANCGGPKHLSKEKN